MPLTTTPKTWIGNTDLTAADLNTHLRDQLLDLDRRVDRRIVGSRYAVTRADVEDTTDETTCFSFPVAANDIADGDRLQLRWVATFAANQFYAGNLTMRLRWGDTVVTVASATNLRNRLASTTYFTIDAFRAGANLVCAAQSSGDADKINLFFGFGGVETITPALDAAHTVALSMELSSGMNTDVYYRVVAGSAIRIGAAS